MLPNRISQVMIEKIINLLKNTLIPFFHSKIDREVQTLGNNISLVKKHWLDKIKSRFNKLGILKLNCIRVTCMLMCD